MTAEAIRIRGARQNNLAGVDVDIPRGRLVAITGVSGSGKSSLAFDTLFREGQRRFLETLSAYARQFLGRMEKPDVDHIDGLSPAIAVDQHSIQRGPRSTVGTLTEIHDHLRVLYARAGTAHCPEHGSALQGQTPESIVRQIQTQYAGQAVLVLAPLVRDRKGEHLALFEEYKRKGYVRVRVDGQVLRLEEARALERYKRHSIELVVDRLSVKDETRARLREAVETALRLSSGDVVVSAPAGEQSYSTLRACPSCGSESPLLEPRLFSFNSPHGSCPTCEGLGVRRSPSLGRVLRDPALSLRRGALAVTRAAGGALLFPHVDFRFLEAVGAAHDFDLDTPWRDLSKSARQVVLHGSGEQRYRDQFSWNGKKYQGRMSFERGFQGVLPALENAWRSGSRQKQVARFLEYTPCPDCRGTRLNRSARAVRFAGTELSALLECPVERLPDLLDGLRPSPRESAIAGELLREIRRRLAFLEQVGLGYLCLARSADSLSGGEAQRIRLAAQLGSGLQGVLYVLDEPSIGLHARDHEKLLGALRALRDAGNSVVVVEHDEATLRAADWLIDVGPGPGRHGGRIVASGTPCEVAQADSPTGRLLRGEIRFPMPERVRTGSGHDLWLRGARGFNLQRIDVRLPLGLLIAVSGVSGSGKSTLIDATLRRAIERRLGREVPDPEAYDALEGAGEVEDLVCVDAAPIGRTPRSNPATYTDTLGPIRELYSSLPDARMRGWTPSRFSFNVSGGRCESCQGAGAQYVELQFLAPVTVPCPECGGKRFQSETLEARYKGHSIADVLDLTVDDALAFFADLPRIARPLRALAEVGLGYLSLGQPSTTLSGGEAQRVKLAKHLQRMARKHTLYLLDEPTSGLHQEDVSRLVGALQRLVEGGHSVIVVEHNLDLIRAADHVIELGPGAGEAGGRLVYAGTPEDLARQGGSPTGVALRAQALGRLQAGAPEAKGEAVPRAEVVRALPLDHIEIRGARTHNLQALDVDIPRDRFTVVTGVSGSGKSSLALDTIHAAGRARFVESLSTYARQFLGDRDKPPVDRIEGLGPSVAVESGSGGAHPRSSVATTTEIHDHLRVLWARAGTPRCPSHGEALRPADAGHVARRMVHALEGRQGWIVAPVFGPDPIRASGRAGALEQALAAWRAAGYARVLVDGQEQRLDGAALSTAPAARIDLVIDRLSFGPATRARVAEAVEQAAALAGGRVSAQARDGERLEYSTRGACTRCGFQLGGPLEPRHFSFNTHVGACQQCDGLGEHWQCSSELLVDRPEQPLLPRDPGCECAISGKLARYLLKGKGYYEHLLRAVAKVHRLRLERPFQELDLEQRELVLHGSGALEVYPVEIAKHGATFDLRETFKAAWPGLCGHVDAWHAKSEDPGWRLVLEGYMQRAPCRACAGERLAPAPRATTLGSLRLPEFLRLSVSSALDVLAELALPAQARQAVAPVLDELTARLELLARVGLEYLTLDRPTGTLSGGEARRVRLASALGSKLVGVCYVLDEPTVGLHPRDIDRLTDALLGLRALGNTVIAVEHDEHLMRRADWIVDMGPGAGPHGGRVVVSGPPEVVAAHPESLTGRSLRGELRLCRTRAAGAAGATDAPGRALRIEGAGLNNLRDVDLEARYGELTGVCGPSGSGKSTLVLDTLVPALRGEAAQGRWRRFHAGAGAAHRLLVVDASPLGRTPASIPATAIGLMEPLRELYARIPEARMRGFSSAHFSFNSAKGRCPACEGRGATLIEMQFLADLWLVCEECDGTRYRPEVLEIRWRGKSIAQVLQLPVDSALDLFEHHPLVARGLQAMSAVGLGYLSLGQGSTTLSVGEAQRVKLAAELLRADSGERSVIVLDEPSTGLSTADVEKLLGVLARLVDQGDCVILIEHHVGLLCCCDRLVELGPGGGESGGRIIALGTPLELAANPGSVTGPWLSAALGGLPRTRSAERGSRRKRRTIEVSR